MGQLAREGVHSGLQPVRDQWDGPICDSVDWIPLSHWPLHAATIRFDWSEQTRNLC